MTQRQKQTLQNAEFVRVLLPTGAFYRPKERQGRLRAHRRRGFGVLASCDSGVDSVRPPLRGNVGLGVRHHEVVRALVVGRAHQVEMLVVNQMRLH